MDSEKINDALLWVLKQLVALCPPLAAVNKAVFTDKGARMLTLTCIVSILPEAQLSSPSAVDEDIIKEALANSEGFLCAFHMGMNVKSNLNRHAAFSEVISEVCFFVRLSSLVCHRITFFGLLCRSKSSYRTILPKPAVKRISRLRGCFSKPSSQGIQPRTCRRSGFLASTVGHAHGATRL